MRVAIDARNLQDRPIGGIGRVLQNVLPRLAPSFELSMLYDPRRGPSPADGVVLRSPVPTATAWLQDAVPRSLKGFDGIFHCPFYALPYRQPVPMVVGLWDLTFESHPHWFPAAKRVAFRTQARHAARTARRVLVGSQTVKAEVIARYGVDQERIVVAPLAADPRFAPRADDSSPAFGPNYIVAFGGASRRRPDLAVAAWLRAGGPSLCSLVVIGDPGVVATPGAVVAAAMSDDTLAATLGGASALLYPTEYEGFGLPAVEAQASGAPVICAPVGALPEVLGDAAVWVPDATVEGFAAALAGILSDRERHQRVVTDGLAWARSRPGWSVAASAFERAFREAAEA